MRLWTIQSHAAWRHLERQGHLDATRAHQADLWPRAYDWMRTQLTWRVGPPPGPDSVPLWGWFQWSGAARRRPDLRAVRHHWHPAGRHVLIECELPASAVVLSDFDAWHVILNDGFVALSQAEDEAFDVAREAQGWSPGRPLPDGCQEELLASWERVIDLHLLTAPYWHSLAEKSIQACFWRLSWDQVRSHRPFVSRVSSRPG